MNIINFDKYKQFSIEFNLSKVILKSNFLSLIAMILFEVLKLCISFQGFKYN